MGITPVVLNLENGMYEDVSFDDYKQFPGLNNSLLKRALDGAEHLHHYLSGDREETSSMRLGTAAHCAILEPKRFEEDYTIWAETNEDGSTARRYGKKWDAFKAACDAAKTVVISKDEYEKATAMAAAIREHPAAAPYFASGSPEVTMLWDNPFTNDHALDVVMDNLVVTRCKGRLDWYVYKDGRPTLVGLKTATDVDPVNFAKKSLQFGYDMQWAYYKDGFQQITGEGVVDVVEIVVRSTAPHIVAVYNIPVGTLDFGRARYQHAMNSLVTSLSNKQFAPSFPKLLDLEVPAWLTAQTGSNGHTEESDESDN